MWTSWNCWWRSVMAFKTHSIKASLKKNWTLSIKVWSKQGHCIRVLMIKMKTKIQKHFKVDNCIVGNDRNCSPNQEGEITTLPLIFTSKIREETAALKMWEQMLQLKNCHHLLLLCMPNFINCLVENFHTRLTICERWQVKWKSKYWESVWRNLFTVKKNEQCHYKFIFLF